MSGLELTPEPAVSSAQSISLPTTSSTKNLDPPGGLKEFSPQINKTAPPTNIQLTALIDGPLSLKEIDSEKVKKGLLQTLETGHIDSSTSEAKDVAAALLNAAGLLGAWGSLEAEKI